MGNSAAAALNEAVWRSHHTRVLAGAPHSGPEALALWSTIDPDTVDIGRFAERVREGRKRLDVKNLRPIRVIKKAHEKYVRVLVWDPFRDFLISGGGDGWIRLWDTSTFSASSGFDTKKSVRSLLVLREELICGHGNGDVTVWAMERSSKPHLQDLNGHTEAVYSLVTLQTGALLTGANDIRIYRRDPLEGFKLMLIHAEVILCACAITGTSQIATGNMNSLVMVWDTSSSENRSREDDHTTEPEWELVASLQGHLRAVWALCYAVSSNVIVSGSADYTIRIWELGSWNCKHILSEHSNWVVGLSATSGCLLSCSNDHTVKAWDTETWNCIQSFNEHQYEVYSVCAFSGGRFASTGAQRHLLLYGGPEHRGDLTRSALKDELSTPAVTREPLTRRTTSDDQERGSSKSGHVRFDTAPLSTGDDCNAPLQGMLAEAYEKKKSTASKDGYPSDKAVDHEQLLKQRRAKLMASSNLDITMSDFRKQLVTAQDPGIDIQSDRSQQNRRGGRLPDISENGVDSCPVQFGSSIDAVPQSRREERPSVDSVSSVRTDTSVTSRNSAFDTHKNGAFEFHSSTNRTERRPPQRKAISVSVQDADDMMFETCKAVPKMTREESPDLDQTSESTIYHEA